MLKRSVKSLLLVFVFIIATVSMALHELSPHHHSETCDICIVDEHSLSSDIIEDVPKEAFVSFCEQYHFAADVKRADRFTSLNARAPPHSFL